MGWFNSASSSKVVLDLKGKRVAVDVSKIESILKDHIRNSKSLMNLFSHFKVHPDRLNELRIELADLDDKYAETDSEVLKLNPSLFDGGHFFRDYFFVVAHELVHWLSRIREEDAYFNDPEETLGFVSSIAYEMSQGTDNDGLWNKIYPKVSWHFNDERDARQFFQRSIEKAKSLL